MDEGKGKAKLLEVKGLRTFFDTRKGPVKAVDGISYNVAPGEIAALVGESGCGKTVSALSLLRLIPEPPAKILNGEAWFEGRDLLTLNAEEMHHIRGRKIAMVFQEPMSSLNPVLTIGRQLSESLVAHELMDWEQARKEAISLLDKVGIPDAGNRLNQYPDQFSGGMRQRVMFAMALSCSPSLIIADEPTTAVDVTVQAQLLELLNSLSQSYGVAVLLITHNLGMVAKYAHRVNVMYAGRIVEKANIDEIFNNPRHPYTQALLSCVPRLDQDQHVKLVPIEGQPPDLVNRPPGCAFNPRCFCVRPECREEWPPLIEVSDGHMAACPYYDGR
ncbi:ABC transporter ATP-binding protein [Chloroflexota bacterium]